MIMYLREKINELQILKTKLNNLKFYIKNNPLTVEQIDIVLKHILKYVEDIQNIRLILNKINNKTTITIGTSQIDVNTAVIIRDTIDNKIKLIDDLFIISSGCDTSELLSQRDSLQAEFNSIDNAIQITDWRIQLD